MSLLQPLLIRLTQFSVVSVLRSLMTCQKNLQDSMTPTNFTSVFVQTRDSWRKKDSSCQQKQLPAFQEGIKYYRVQMTSHEQYIVPRTHLQNELPGHQSQTLSRITHLRFNFGMVQRYTATTKYVAHSYITQSIHQLTLEDEI